MRSEAGRLLPPTELTVSAAAVEDLVEDSNKPTIFGLTGGIATGKSFVSALLRRRCIPVVDADEVAREVVKPRTSGLTQLVEAFGADILLENGRLDRSKLGEMVFGNIDQLNKLNAILQPLIAEEAAFQIRLHLLLNCRIICYDAALLVEVGLADQFRPLVVVSCKPELQLARLIERGMTDAQARARIASQMSSAAKEEVADTVIDTNGTKIETTEQVDALVSGLMSDG